MRLPELGPEQAQALVMPRIELPFAACLHPAHGEFDGHVVRWMVEHRLLSDERQGHAGFTHRPAPGRLMGWLYPHGNTDVVLTITQMGVWARMLDDHIADPAAEAHDLAAMTDQILVIDSIIHDPDAAPEGLEHPMYDVLHDLWQRIRAIASPQQFTRLQRAVLRACIGFAAEAAHSSDLPTVTQYRAIRRNTSTLDLFMVLAEIAVGLEIPPQDEPRHEMQALISVTADVFSTLHEIITCHKDVYTADKLNLAILLAREYACTVQDGLDMAAKELRNGVARFQESAKRLLDVIDRAEWAQRWVSTLEHMLGGYLKWLTEVWLSEEGEYDFSRLAPAG